MFDDLYKFQFTENNLTSLITTSKKYQTIGFTILLLLSITEFILFIFLVDYFMMFLVSLITSASLFVYVLSRFKRKISQLKENFLRNNVDYLGRTFKKFEDFRTYNLLDNIIKKNSYKIDKDFFNDIIHQCDNVISPMKHLTSLTPTNVLIYTSVIGFFSNIIITIFKEFKELRIQFISATCVAIAIYLVFKSLDSFIFESTKSTIYKYKTFKVQLKNAEILHKQLLLLSGDQYFLNKDCNIVFIATRFCGENFTNDDLDEINTFIKYVVSNKIKK